MRSIVGIILGVLLVFSIGCKKKKKTTEEADSTIIKIESASKLDGEENNFETIENCDEFIDQYEAWTKEYVSLLKKHKGNPVDLVSSPEYAAMTMQAMEWATNWDSKLTTSCATNPNYEKRMRQIQKNMEKRLEQIGLE